jgi:hypothetical protein
LLIVLHNLGGSNARRIRIASELASGAPLAQEIPTLIELHFEGSESLVVTIRECPLPVQRMFLLHKSLDMLQDRPIALLLCHGHLPLVA